MNYEDEIAESAECASVFKLAEYINKTHEKRKKNAKCHISYYSDSDKERIMSVMNKIGYKNFELFSNIEDYILEICRSL